MFLPDIINLIEKDINTIINNIISSNEKALNYEDIKNLKIKDISIDELIITNNIINIKELNFNGKNYICYFNINYQNGLKLEFNIYCDEIILYTHIKYINVNNVPLNCISLK